MQSCRSAFLLLQPLSAMAPEKKGRLSAAMNAKLRGSGSEVLVLAHGYGGDQTVWDKIISTLAQHFTVLSFDWTFSGAVKDQSLFDPLKYSSYHPFADDLIGLLEEMKFRSTLFVGHSMSGMIGCIASIKRPSLFKRLVLIGASPRYMNTENYEGGFEKNEIDQILSGLESNYQTWSKNFASLVVDSDDSCSVNHFNECLKRMRYEFALPLAKMVFGCDERQILEKVETPCTIIQTSKDMVVPGSVGFYMQSRIKGKSTVEIVDTNGHFPQLTAPLQLLDLLGVVLSFRLSV